MALDIGELQLRVKTDSEKASSAIDKLSHSLSGLRDAAKGQSGLSNTAKKLDRLAESLNGISTEKISVLERLSNILKGLPTVKTNIGSVATQISKLGAAVGTLSGKSVSEMGTSISTLVKALEPLSNMPKQNISSYFAQIKKFPEVLSNLNTTDLNEFKKKIREVADALKPLADEMEKVSKGFSAFPSKIQKFLNSAERMPKTAHRSARSFVKLGAKIGAYGYTINRVGRVLGNFIKETNDYVETYNLFSVSMGKYAKEAEKYARTVESVLGIDPKEWMRAQGVFQTLATGFGVASDRAYTMSKNLTQLGYDLSSFFNISVAESMQKLQSALAGELEPVNLAA